MEIYNYNTYLNKTTINMFDGLDKKVSTSFKLQIGVRPLNLLTVWLFNDPASTPEFLELQLGYKVHCE